MENETRISGKAWAGILIGAAIIGLMILGRMDQPGPISVVLAFVVGLVLAMIGWSLLAIGWEYGKKS